MSASIACATLLNKPHNLFHLCTHKKTVLLTKGLFFFCFSSLMKTLAYGVARLTRPFMNMSSIHVFVHLRALSDKRFHDWLDMVRNARIRRCSPHSSVHEHEFYSRLRSPSRLV